MLEMKMLSPNTPQEVRLIPILCKKLRRENFMAIAFPLK
ncbi:hypothetical protein GM3709_560 [Geminocystis sp. NIES-3709]|nr:hypothetical protein GM3709_560 [Geminocystis sp. NIES-3709]